MYLIFFSQKNDADDNIKKGPMCVGPNQDLFLFIYRLTLFFYFILFIKSLLNYCYFFTFFFALFIFI